MRPATVCRLPMRRVEGCATRVRRNDPDATTLGATARNYRFKSTAAAERPRLRPPPARVGPVLQSEWRNRMCARRASRQYATTNGSGTTRVCIKRQIATWRRSKTRCIVATNSARRYAFRNPTRKGSQSASHVSGAWNMHRPHNLASPRSSATGRNMLNAVGAIILGSKVVSQFRSRDAGGQGR